ncbi:MAG TPA: sigma-70 family RNA polymerase sigma factor [Terriglobales bacterium]|nr:sigma-70 family RNA polymerase sigma factor [Terriglobales bacterium]
MNENSLQLAVKTRTDDLALVHATKNGDIAAFEELVRRYDRKLFRIAQHVTQNREDAQDVVQEAFFKAFQKLDQFQEKSQFSTWLIRITLNQSLMNLRKQHRKKEVQVDHDVLVEGDIVVPLEVADWTPNPEERYEASELRAILIQALQQLGPALSVVFVLRDMEGLSTEEASQALDLSQAAVKARLMRARLRLRERLSKHFKKAAVEVIPTCDQRVAMLAMS